jgi:hypothetical protein
MYNYKMNKISNKAIKINPASFKYKMISFNVVEKDDLIQFEFNSGQYPVQAQYNPCSVKGHTLTIKLDYTTLEKQSYRNPGVELFFNIHSLYSWYIALLETETGITMELHSGNNPMYIDHQNKIVTNNIHTIGLQNNQIFARIVPPVLYE